MAILGQSGVFTCLIYIKIAQMNLSDHKPKELFGCCGFSG
ncbi:hypothetical protein AO371_1234 [Moraxella catarrhalis]|nr:hypothetical protein AO376_0635 [Moraxella catarrhalis]OAV20855.1 hypothetical protein AO374_0349 [Moraxella catarrhalis]OAV23743.1 hypothetical protein AO371_1234 [Moraxella catarrhalis]